MRKKVTIVGAGNVGATAAHWIAAKELADVVLIDVIEGVPQGKGLDLLEAMPIEKRDVSIIGTNDYAATANSDIVVITAGIARKPGMSRDDLLNTNFKIMSDVVEKVVAASPNTIIIRSEGVPQGKGLDLLEAMPIEKRDVSIIGTNDYAATANSDIVVITAGIARKPGMSRDDLLNTNFKIMSDVVEKVVAASPNTIII